jgi:C_GCAxxG_C_C family probable redox protein
LIKKRVYSYYWIDDINCATTTIKILSEIFNIQIEQQVLDSAIGLHGAGEYGAQCGLVEGTLIFLGIYGRHNKIEEKEIIKLCKEFATKFEAEFKSLQCSILRPEGFKEDNPPHLCEILTCNAISFSRDFISNIKTIHNRPPA